MRREIYTTVMIFVTAIALSIFLLSCAPPTTGMPEGQYAYLPRGSVICERRGALTNYVDDKLAGKDAMIRLLMERRRAPGGSNYSVPTCHVLSTPQRVQRMWGEPEPYADTVRLRKVSLRGSIVNFWTLQSFMEWRTK